VYLYSPGEASAASFCSGIPNCRFSAYQTSGELFRAIEKDTLQLTVSEHIWQIIISIVAEIAQILSIDPEELILELMSENQRLAKFINLKPSLQAGVKSLRKSSYL
jgi:hypothetical protein